MKIAVGFSEKMARLEILSVFSQVAEARIGRLSSSQREFTTIRSKKNSLIELDKKWNGEEDPLLSCSEDFKPSSFTARGT